MRIKNTTTLRPYKFLALLLTAIFTHTIVSINAMPQVQQADAATVKGTPRIIHHTLNDFHGDSQFWSMCEDEKGIKYFGNNDGILVFDGSYWHKIGLKNSSSVRSLFYSSDGTVYAGGYNEFGTVERDAFGQYHFNSLVKHLPPTDLNFENIWSIKESKGKVILRSFDKLIVIEQDRLYSIPAKNSIYSNSVNDKYYIVDDEGIMLLDDEMEFQMIATNDRFNDEIISSILAGSSPKELSIITREGSFYSLDLESKKINFINRYLPMESTNRIMDGIKTQNNEYYLGTLTNQLIILNEKGQVAYPEDYINLQDNTVLNLFESSRGNIWALLNNGIDCINPASPVSILYKDASIFDALLYDKRLYVATNQGVVISTHELDENKPFKAMGFEKSEGLEAQAWSLLQIEGSVVCSLDKGLFVISEKETYQIPGIKGVWKVLPLLNQKNKFFACTYDGIYLLEYKEERLKLLNRIEGFDESSRDIMEDPVSGEFWVCHGYKGIFRIKIDKDLQQVTRFEHFRDQGLPSPFNINVSNWRNMPVFTTNHGIFKFNDEVNEFQPVEELNRVFGLDKNVRKLVIAEDKTWFVHDDELGYFTQESQKLEKDLFLELKATFNRSMECIIPLNTHNLLVGTKEGLFLYNTGITDQQYEDSRTLINSFYYTLNQEKVIKEINIDEISIPYDAINLHFSYSAPNLRDQLGVQYRIKMEGLQKEWSKWSQRTSYEYSKLLPGNYQFTVEARSTFGETAKLASISFKVTPVWYRTRAAYLVYMVLIIISIFITRQLFKSKIGKETSKTRQEEQKKQSVLQLEIQQMRLEREKERIERDKELLEVDVVDKSKELANYTMLLVKKRELITELREELTGLKEHLKNEKSRNIVRTLIRKIGIHLNDEEHIHVFETNFERVHQDFFNELKAHYPDLTAKELRLCALVRMNLTNKEIAPILNISHRGVETARYRLRKRLSLDHEENMVEFLDKLSGL